MTLCVHKCATGFLPGVAVRGNFYLHLHNEHGPPDEREPPFPAFDAFSWVVCRRPSDGKFLMVHEPVSLNPSRPAASTYAAAYAYAYAYASPTHRLASPPRLALPRLVSRLASRLSPVMRDPFVATLSQLCRRRQFALACRSFGCQRGGWMAARASVRLGCASWRKRAVRALPRLAPNLMAAQSGFRLALPTPHSPQI